MTDQPHTTGTQSLLYGRRDGAYLRLVFNTPVPAVGRAQALLDLPELDRNLALLYIAEHFPNAVEDALGAVSCLPCFDGCGHDRHTGEPCTVGLLDPPGPCGCGLVDALRADRRVEYGDDELRDAGAEERG